ncbi:THO complex subunit 1 transcription elongation factor-domain-containing protein [Xylariomycetidae sp. FL2044]|nr:THO complex subunit 1 transcription elongation factor-domain-containing protein [Xylariomycetidae sp. FL2044]
MPSATNPDYEVPQVDAVVNLLKDCLEYASTVKTSTTVDPPLAKSHFEDFLARLQDIFSRPSSNSVPENANVDRVRQYAVVETASRNVFSNIIARTSIDSPEFVQVWNLFDLLSVLSDSEHCDSSLLFWLVEELLDSQTIEGCRKIFDYLESRRERITSKNMNQKKLVILRSCNDLLRRLSRAEDTAFCGRVYIFMFQSFPLGDRSSVNLRGEYHVENVTTFEESQAVPEPSADKMDVDTTKDEKDPPTTAKAVSFDAKNKTEPAKPLDTDALYPVFWSLQHLFSQPTTLFESSQLAKFKSGMEATMSAFETVVKLQRTTKTTDENSIIPQKRKDPEEEDLRGTNNNPKYLTSRELFELEISDTYFRRHILIQAFIVIDFLLSLTPQSRAKLANIKQQNRSVVYGDKTIEDEDANWAKAMKDRITSYIQAEPDGFFFFRVIESVISRDKNWVRWKVESCPEIKRDPVAPAEFNEAVVSVKRIATNKRLRPTPMGSLSLDFLKEENSETAMEKLKDPSRWKLPELDTFKDKIARDDLDLEFANTEKEKSELLDSKASKTWRALRIARRHRLAAFDKIDDWQKIDAIFQDQVEEEQAQEEAGEKATPPADQRPIILSGSRGVGKSTLLSLLSERKIGVFGKVIPHTTRSPKDGEVNGKDYHFVDSKAFNMILDGDYFLEFSTRDGVDYGTSRKMAEATEEAGKIPVMELYRDGTQMAKDNGYSARVIFICPPSIEELEVRLKSVEGLAEAGLQSLLQAARDETEQAKSGGLYDKVITNGDLEEAYKELEGFIYGEAVEQTNGINGKSSDDVRMEDAENGDAGRS